MERLRAEHAAAVSYLERLQQTFGRPFLLLLVSACAQQSSPACEANEPLSPVADRSSDRCCFAAADMGVKGALYYIVVLSQLPYYREMGVGAAQYQIYGSIANTPWAMKGLIGAISDALPLGGYHKRGYIAGSCVVGVASFALLAAVPFAADHARICAALFFLASVELSVVDLLCEGRYAEMMVKHPQTGSDLVTWVWMSYHVGALIGSTLTGPMADFVSPRAIFWVALPLAAQILIPTLSGALMGTYAAQVL